MEKQINLSSEQEVLQFWQDNNIPAKTLELNKSNSKEGKFIFYEGPPSANAKPAIHHVISRVYKDVVLRYQTMLGKYIPRQAGWDTHGLPIELAVEKQLGINGKQDIEKYGIAKFNRHARDLVLQYVDDWEKLTDRIAFWLNKSDAYVTYDNKYIEGLWSTIYEIHQKKLLYKGHRVVPHCPRCETALSSHEVAQGYKKVSEDSIYIKFKVSDQTDTFILVWTTTPWTLPGNLVLAVNSSIDYVYALHKEETLILAKERLKILDGEYKIVKEVKGADLVGLKYNKLFENVDISNENKSSYTVLAGDFVTTTDGSGIVHIAPMYGEDDYNLAIKNNLPLTHTVLENGRFNSNAGQWAEKIAKDEITQREITVYLKDKNELYKSEKYSHDYPYCWRCDTALLYYAKDSWFIEMSKLRRQLQSENSTINWIPDNIKNGRFGGWLSEIRDWALSRERYWGTPIPIWKCQKCEQIKVVQSQSELKSYINRNNNFYFARHGESEKNVLGISSSAVDKYPLTQLGRKQAQKIADELLSKKITKIIASPVLRAKQTAQIIADKFKLEVSIDDRLSELGCGQFEGKNVDEEIEAFKNIATRWEPNRYDTETFSDLTRRMIETLSDLNSQYTNENILIVSHGDPIWLALAALENKDNANELETIKYPEVGTLVTAKVDIIDLHRPYIDEIKIPCEQCQTLMSREPYVMDVWFDSGAMPIAAGNEDRGEYPADYICEAIDQTRGWFYTLLAVAVARGKSTPYKNVISLGHLQDENGRKMSKSKGNVIDPWEVIDKYGTDALRMYLFTMNEPGQTKRFNEHDLQSVNRQVVQLLQNIKKFYSLNLENHDSSTKPEPSFQKLDEWMQIRTMLAVEAITSSLDKYDVTSAGREIIDLISDIANWYIRRSRKRKDNEFIETLCNTIKITSLLIAPFAPFIAEQLYQTVRSSQDKESVHMDQFPNSDKVNQTVLNDMSVIRKLASIGLMQRAGAKIKVRQPLSLANISSPPIDRDLFKLLADELNVLEIKHNISKDISIDIDLTINDDLKRMGLIRELIRSIQDLRKNSGFSQNDKANLSIDGVTLTDIEIENIQNSTSCKFVQNISSAFESKVEGISIKVSK